MRFWTCKYIWKRLILTAADISRPPTEARFNAETLNAQRERSFSLTPLESNSNECTNASRNRAPGEEAPNASRDDTIEKLREQVKVLSNELQQQDTDFHAQLTALEQDPSIQCLTSDFDIYPEVGSRWSTQNTGPLTESPDSPHASQPPFGRVWRDDIGEEIDAMFQQVHDDARKQTGWGLNPRRDLLRERVQV